MNKTIVIEGTRIGENRKPGDVGFDLKVMDDVVVLNNNRTILPTDHKVKLPYETEEQVRPRSGFSAKGMEGIPLKEEKKRRKQWKDIEGLYHVELVFKPISDETDHYNADVLLGTIDPDYPDRVGVIVNSNDNHSFLVPKDTRVAQAVFNDVVIPQLVMGVVEKNNRRDGGFGTSGAK